MSAPLLIGAGAELQREIQRLQKLNRELREANDKLQLQVSALSSSSSSLHTAAASGPSRRSGASALSELAQGNGGDTEGKGAANKRESTAALAKLKTLADTESKTREAAEAELATVKRNFKSLNAQFESFVSYSSEREEAYKQVYAGIFTEMEERKALCETLQAQLQREREQPTSVTPTAAVVATADTQAGIATLAPARVSPQVAEMLLDLESTVADLKGLLSLPEGHQHHGRARKASRATQRRKSQRSRHDDADVSVDDNVALLPTTAAAAHGEADVNGHVTPAFATRSGAAPAAQVYIAKGAGILRDAVVSSPAQPRASKRTRETTSSRGSVQKVPRRALTEVAAAGTRAGGNLFESFATQAAVRSAAAAATSTSSSPLPGAGVQFGKAPITDFLTLVDQTQPAHLEKLRQELLRYCGRDTDVLVTHIMSHVMSRSSREAEPVRLWKELERIVDIHRPTVYPTLCDALIARLVKGLGPESATILYHSHTDEGVEEQHACADLCHTALALRYCLLQHGKRIGAPQCVALHRSFYELSISALKTWRGGAGEGQDSETLGEGGRNTTGTAERGRGVLRVWMRVVETLCGFQEARVQSVLVYFNAVDAGEGLILSQSLSTYTIQGVMSLCWAASCDASSSPSAAVTTAQQWCAFCDLIGWSHSQIPIEGIDDAATRGLVACATSSASDDSLLALRVLVVYKGFGHLHALKTRFPAGCNVDDAFAQLLSYAVTDLQLHDAKDEQWRLSMAFFGEYLQRSYDITYDSAEEVASSTKAAHVLVARAIVQLCGGLVPVSEEGGVDTADSSTIPDEALQPLKAAMRWLHLHKAAALDTRFRGGSAGSSGNSRGKARSSSLLDSSIGHSLLSLTKA